MENEKHESFKADGYNSLAQISRDSKTWATRVVYGKRQTRFRACRTKAIESGKM